MSILDNQHHSITVISNGVNAKIANRRKLSLRRSRLGKCQLLQDQRQFQEQDHQPLQVCKADDIAECRSHPLSHSHTACLTSQHSRG